jgi:hypothetical protein
MLLAMLLTEIANARTLVRTSSLVALLRAGFTLARLGRPVLTPLRWTAGYFWIVAILMGLLRFGLDFVAIEPPRRFELGGLETQGFALVVTLLVSYLVARAVAMPRLIWSIAGLLTTVGLFITPVVHLLYFRVLPEWETPDRRWYWAAFALTTLWWLGVLLRMFDGLGVRQGALARVRIAGAAIGLFTLHAYFVPPVHFWEQRYSVADVPPGLDPLVAEEVFGAQHDLLEETLAGLLPGHPATPDLYFVSFSPYGTQQVFQREALYAQQLFEQRFGAEGRTVALINHRDQLAALPLATATNLQRTLQWLGQNMNVEDDILFLFLNSHGARNAELQVELEDLSFRPVTADALAQMLARSGIRWKVVVVSSCYSGSFIPALQDEHTLLITAARADRTSFGCEDAADFTYFGRAYFEQGLSQTGSFTEAFGKAKSLVAAWERKDNYEQSEPQMVVGEKIGAKLRDFTSRSAR